MGLGIVIIFYLLASAVVFGVAAALCTVVWLLVRKRWPKLRLWLIAAPVAVGLAPTALLVVGLLWVNLEPPGVRFKDVFDVPAGPSIHDL